ncbi:MAG: DNA-binding protein [Actinomycetia bacterium]|nr:DNA-binding protein [Actinomycetes bacterium]
MAEAPPFRILPRVTSNNEFFWTGGLHDELRFLRCQDDGYYIHPVQPICPICHGKNLAPETVSGRATVVSYTVNHQAWMPAPELPYVVALVEIEEQAGLRLMTNTVGIAPEDVRIGLEVEATFEHHVDADGDVWIPLFQPRSGKGA